MKYLLLLTLMLAACTPQKAPPKQKHKWDTRIAETELRKHQRYLDVSVGTGEIANKTNYAKVAVELGISLADLEAFVQLEADDTDDPDNYHVGLRKVWVTDVGIPHVEGATNTDGFRVGAGFKTELVRGIDGVASVYFEDDYAGHNSEMGTEIGIAHDFDNYTATLAYSQNDTGAHGSQSQDWTTLTIGVRF